MADHAEKLEDLKRALLNWKNDEMTQELTGVIQKLHDAALGKLKNDHTDDPSIAKLQAEVKFYEAFLKWPEKFYSSLDRKKRRGEVYPE